MGRRSLDIVVKELPLKDCVKFWGKAASRIAPREIIDVLSVTGRGRKGCQIDLLIQSRRTICVVEIKRRKEIGREIIEEVDAKVGAIARPSGVSIRAALVFDGHISPGVAADGYFSAIVPFRKLLGV